MCRARLIGSDTLALIGQLLLLGVSGLVALTIVALLVIAAVAQIRRGQRLARLREIRSAGRVAAGGD